MRLLTALFLLVCLHSLTHAQPAVPANAAQPGLSVALTFSPKVQPTPFSGRVFLVVSRKPLKDEAFRQLWYTPEPYFSLDVQNWKPGTPLAFTPRHEFPEPLARLPAGKYYVQALLDRDQGGQSALAAPGNGFSKPQTLEWTGKPQRLELVIDQVVPQRKFVEKERVKLVEIESKLLTAFHGKPMKLRAGVLLPNSFAAAPDKKYPVVYEIPGFGGDHHMVFSAEARNASDIAGVEALYVVLDPACRLGHHVFADSDNNGPVGRALVEELIPILEKSYRGVGRPEARLVTGHSSGGWSSLWLQVRYADVFGGVWSTAPDPIDFRDFQKVNIYAPGTNLFRDEKGELRPLSRKNARGQLQYKSFSDMEVVAGRGGQLFSFEAVFGPKGPDGQPVPLWDRTTGAIDPKVAQAWQRYDIRLVLERNWAVLEPKLRGKLHVYMGAEDTYLLEGATRLLQKSLKDLGSDAVVEIVPGRDHGNLLEPKLRQRIAREMADALQKKSARLESQPGPRS